MKVKMLVATYWDGKSLKAGDVLDVDETTQARWEKAGIAQTSEEPDNGEPDDGEPDKPPKGKKGA